MYVMHVNVHVYLFAYMYIMFVQTIGILSVKCLKKWNSKSYIKGCFFQINLESSRGGKWLR